MLIDISFLKRRERLLEAMTELMASAVREDFFLNTEQTQNHVLNAMHALYAEHHNCGYVYFPLVVDVVMDEDSTVLPSMNPLFVSYEPLADMTRQWISNKVMEPVREQCDKSRLYQIPVFGERKGKVLIEPTTFDDRHKIGFFWIFSTEFPSENIEADRERRNTFLIAAITALRAAYMRLDNLHKTSDLAILHRATLEIGKMNSLQQIADAALGILEKEKGWHPSVIRFRSRTEGTLETAAYRGLPGMSQEENQKRMDYLNSAIDRPGKGMIGHVIKHGVPIRSLDLRSNPHYIETSPDINYGIYAPIIVEGNIEGAIGVESVTYRFMESDLKLLSSIGEIVGMSVRSLRLIEMLRQRVNWLEIFHQINQQIGVDTKPGELYQILVDKAIEAIGAESATLIIYDPSQNVLRKAVARGWLEKIMNQPINPSEGISGRIFSTGKLRISPLISKDPLVHPQVVAFVPPGRANVGVPVIAEGTVLGVFHIAVKASVDLSQELIDIVEMFGSYAGIVIGRMQLIEALRNAEKMMRTAYDETLEGWARAIGLRDDNTLQHTVRVVKIAVALGEYLNLDPRMLEDMRRGALLHDVGKIGIPDTILRKPGNLNDEEMAIMRTHTSFGYELLRPIKFLEGAIVVPYCHHERWDGTGYPRHLKGEEIPLLARIFAVADVYDAMTSDRPYRHAHTIQEAIDYIKSQSARHFDPHIVGVFLTNIDTIEE